ncbi:MAG: response regulator, partial [Flavobacteriales bacterium]
MDERIRILWADDEIDLLKPHVLFLEEKGYELTTVNSGDKALDMIASQRFDIVFLDENMPGMTGLDVLPKIKSSHPSLPVIMITKSEEERIMEDALGSRISDYLIKPVHPNQILLAIKKNLHTSQLINEKTTSNYREEFSAIGAALNDRLSTDGWIELYKKLVYWELALEKSGGGGMSEIFNAQKSEANQYFFRFVARNYFDWIKERGDDIPLMSHQLFNYKVAPMLNNDSGVYLLLIDNLRYDQWQIIRPVLANLFVVEKDELYFSILPTATQYARNAIFSGLLPADIAKHFPNLWVGEHEDEGKNLHEKAFIESQLIRLNKQLKF